MARANRLLQEEPGDVVERGYLLVHEMHQHIGRGDFPRALEIAPRIAQYGREFGDANLVAMGLSGQGRLLLYAGLVPEALALLDEAMIGVTTSEVSPVIAGHVYCAVIEGCQEIRDYARVAQWTKALTQWCQTQPDLVPFTGQCAVHRAQVMRAHSDFPAALDELDRAYQRYTAAGQSPAVGLALSERGDILRIQGAFAAAETAYTEASTYGHDPQPGLALLRLATGNPVAAVAAVRRLLQETTNPVDRSRVLPAAVEVLVADGDLDAAGSAAEEMAAIAESFGCAALRAAAAYTTGIVQVAGGEGAAALPELRRSWQLWTGLDAPYEAARARLKIGLVLREMSDEDSAVAELVAVRKTFAELGAQPCLVEAEQLLPEEPARWADRPGGRGAATGGHRKEQSGDRDGAVLEREDRGPPPEQHLLQDRRLVANRSRRVRLRAQVDLTRELI